MTDQEPTPPPVTGFPAIDDALASVDLQQEPGQHPGQLARALDVLQQALGTPPAPQR